jgi:phage replication initiation protein
MAFGGEAQRGWVSVHLSGTGCQWVGDWGVAQDSLSALPGMQVRRVDVALDTIDPAVVAHDVVVAAHRQGMFSTRGRPPSMRQILPEDPAEGRTVYIGQRDQAKFFRGYEKGYELARAFPKHVQPSHIDGVPIGNLYRCELELKVKDAPLPVDLIDRRDQYFAGAYPFLGHVLKVEPEILVQRREREPELLLQAALARVRQQYGRTLFTALAAYHGDFMAVWDKVVGSQHNMDLVQAGVLLAEHD